MMLWHVRPVRRLPANQLRPNVRRDPDILADNLNDAGSAAGVDLLLHQPIRDGVVVAMDGRGCVATSSWARKHCTALALARSHRRSPMRRNGTEYSAVPKLT